MTDRSRPSSGARGVRWAFGSAFPAVAAIACATAGTWYEVSLVAHAHVYCAGDLSAGEGFAGAVWVLSRFVLFPAVSVGSALLSLPVQLLSRLPWAARRLWPQLLLVLPWWPAWLLT
ncbi:hypothetical protein ACIBK9_34960 [Nonomuraea sp. NPDC050227]|uniref:hypothetical protein n=1 Tax=Nonomuraea sp. NPDC050227 TaxID=3364360 RepID=UPI00379E0F06